MNVTYEDDVYLLFLSRPFLGHIDKIHHNPIHSRKLVHPDGEVILSGNEEDAAEVVQTLGMRHEQMVDPNC